MEAPELDTRGPQDAMYIVETLQPEEAMCSKEEYKMYQLKSLIMSPTPQVVKMVIEVCGTGTRMPKYQRNATTSACGASCGVAAGGLQAGTIFVG
jgi:hypothetical protein